MELTTRYDPKATEEKWYATWEKRGYFHAEANSPKRPYCIVIPPPNITGILHMGHALNNTLQDVLIRWKRMAGYNALWVPGTDHASIATQYVVERQLIQEGSSRKEVGREKFLERVWEWKEKHGNFIIQQLKRLGSSCDWQRERFTMDAGLSRAVCTVFKRLYDEGLIYKGNYLVNWCPRCLTTLSDDEVEYKDQAGKLWYLKYPLQEDDSKFAIVATTRPETMLGDTAVAVNPTDERYVDWIGKHAMLPLANRLIPIIADDFVEKSFGTGMVKITPAHDPNDYAAGKRHGLPEINILTPDAKINNAAPAYEGLDRYEARKRVVADLQAANLIEKIEDYPQRISLCYRCHTAIEPYVSLQWFVKVGPLAEPAREAVAQKRVHFIPETREKDYFHWLDNLRDWSISRQLWWGHRVPAWYCSCGEIIVMDSEKAPTKCPKCGGTDLVQDPDVLDTWFSSALWPFSTLGWPDQTPELKTFYPTDTLVTAKDIIFLWVARMIMMGLHFMDDVPFHSVYFNPIVGDEHGKKMSKSKGNAIDPLELIDEYGTDALRFTMCDYATQEQFIAFSVKRCEGYRNFMNKLWNASRLVFANVDDLRVQDIARAVPVNGSEEQALEDSWIVSRYADTVAIVNSALEGFQYDTAVKAIYDFFWKDFCDYYLEVVKSRLYENPKNASEKPEQIRSRTAAQATLVVVLEGALRLLHPFCPFITEELWTKMREKWGPAPEQSAPSARASAGIAPQPVGSGVVNAESAEATGTLGQRTLEAFESPSIMLAPWNELAPDALRIADIEQEMDVLQSLIYTIRNIRGEMKIPPSTAVRITFAAPENLVQPLRQRADFFTSLTNVKSLEISSNPQPPAFASTGVASGVTVYIELPEEMREQEFKRLEKELARTAGERDRLSAKLSNESFTGKAPAAVVEKEREKLRLIEEEHEKLEAKLRELEA